MFLHFFHQFFLPKRLVFLNAEDEMLSGMEGEIGGHQAERAATQIDTLNQSELPDDIRALAREGAIHRSDARRDLVDQLLTGMSPDQFRQRYEQLRQQEESWGNIFDIQRGIRKRIRETQEQAESYMELLPRKRPTFSSLVQDIEKVNRADIQIEQGMKNTLTPLTKPEEREGADALPSLLTQAEARALYEISPRSPDFDTQFEKLLQPLKNPRVPERAQAARVALNRLRQAKQHEQRIEQRFDNATRQLNKIIELNVGRAEREAEKKRMLKEACRFTGIRMKAGTVLRYETIGEQGRTGHTDTVRIVEIHMNPNPIYDHTGRRIGQAIGIPVVQLSDGQKMSLARFKKWVDATNAREEISSLDELREKLGWQALKIPLEKGTQLEYQRFTRDRSNKLYRRAHYIRVIDIRDGKIYFNEPVLYQTGPGIAGLRMDDEYRPWLTFGEFLKWQERQEVEQSFTLNDLRDKLRLHNKVHNQIFSLKEKDNPPIEVFAEESLYYPDDPLAPFRIQNVSLDAIKLSNGESFTPAQFFTWVRHNHVQRVPGKQKKPEDIQKEEALRHVLEEKIVGRGKAQAELEHHIAEAKKQTPPGEPGGIVNFFAQEWHTTTFLSPKDLWSMIISVKEFIERRHKRSSQGRFAKIGSKLPGVLGTEFKRIEQASENEEVNLNKEAMHNWGIFDVLDRLHATNNKDVAKACIITLVDKGEMRWDEVEVWKTLNRLTARYTTRGSDLFIPTNKKWLEYNKKNGEDMVGPAADALWGTGSFAEWFAKNVSTYNNQKNSFEYKGKQLEADPKGTGGLRGEFKNLLDRWKRGEYVNPHEYEEMIDFALKYGKASCEDKMFYLIMGMITENPKGYGTLLHMDRAGDLDGKYLNQFPLLDFFTNKGALRPDGTIGPWRMHDFEHLADHWFPNDFKRGEPGMEFSKFLWHYMMFDANFRLRMSKGLRNAEQIDHDDGPYFIPPASYTEIDMITGSPGGGEKKYFTPEGYANAYCGFSQYFIAIAASETLAENEEKQVQSIKDIVKSFVWYDAIINYRFRKFDGAKRARLSEVHFNRKSVCDDTVNLSMHRDQLQNLILEIGREYGEDFSYLFEKTGSMHDPNEAKKQKIIEKRFEEFPAAVEALIQRDNGAGVLRVVRRAKDRNAAAKNGLRGMRGWSLRKDQAVVATPEGEKKAKAMGLL